jgi:uncharacterized protein YfiM (DUF2279 family)
MKTLKSVKTMVGTALVSTLLAACGGGGGGGTVGGSVYIPPPSTVIYGPYETVYGDACLTSSPTPGCTFNNDGSRVQVSQDPNYNRYGYGRDDLYFVQFDSYGNASVFDDLGNFLYYKDITNFGGYIGGTTIGVGTTGLFWENVSNGTYWWGANGVLYSANSFESNFGKAINDKTAGKASDSSFAALNSDANKALVKKGAAKLVKDYGMSQSKATAVASALNSWAVAGAERGFTTDKDMDKTFKAVFGVDFKSALAAVKDLQGGSTSSMRELTDRSASALGIKPEQAQKFIKGMYKKALSQWGLDANGVNW